MPRSSTQPTMFALLEHDTTPRGGSRADTRTTSDTGPGRTPGAGPGRTPDAGPGGTSDAGTGVTSASSTAGQEPASTAESPPPIDSSPSPPAAAGPGLPGRPSATARDVHWDLLIEVAGHERLPTWRLRENPIGSAPARREQRNSVGCAAEIPADIPAERIADHRQLYLDYEGEISGGRGVVRRLDRGEALVRHLAGDELRVELRGDGLRGQFEIARGADGGLRFRNVPAAGQHT